MNTEQRLQGVAREMEIQNERLQNTIKAVENGEITQRRLIEELNQIQRRNIQLENLMQELTR